MVGHSSLPPCTGYTYEGTNDLPVAGPTVSVTNLGRSLRNGEAEDAISILEQPLA